MAESSLSIGYPELCSEVGFLIGYGRDSADWSTAQEDEIDRVVQSGVRNVYFPPAQVAELAGYQWSWLQPTATLPLLADTDTYDLPDDFGDLIGELHYAEGTSRQAIVRIASRLLRDMQTHREQSDYPRYVAVDFKASDGASGQRHQAVFYPTPPADVDVTYRYEAYTGKLTDANPYPLGGMQLAELYLESCLAVAEKRVHDIVGLHNEQYVALLYDQAARDRKRGAQLYGPMGHREAPVGRRLRRGDTGITYPVTYHGTTY